MDIIDTRDLHNRQTELQEEKEALELALEEAQEALEEAREEYQEATEDAEIEEAANRAAECSDNKDNVSTALRQWIDENQEELDALDTLEREVGDEWHHGVALIPENDFQEYAQEFAEDIGAIDRNAAWPFSCIDWEQAARELQMDYTSCEYQGDTYLFRE
jgi:DNA repair exonuclease SbcCD ATPase subunit